MRPYEATDIQTRLDMIKDTILSIVPDTETIYLFGSYANGTPHKDSDLDVYVIVPASSGKTLKTEMSIINALHAGNFHKLDYCMPVNLLVKHSSNFHNDKMHATFANIVDKTGMKIYG